MSTVKGAGRRAPRPLAGALSELTTALAPATSLARIQEVLPFQNSFWRSEDGAHGIWTKVEKT